MQFRVINCERLIKIVKFSNGDEFSWCKRYFVYRRFSDFFHITRSLDWSGYDDLFSWNMRLQVFGYSFNFTAK